MSKRGKGRPKVPERKKRKHSVHVLLRYDEYRAVKKAAEADDQTASGWARSVLLKALGRGAE